MSEPLPEITCPEPQCGGDLYCTGVRFPDSARFWTCMRCRLEYITAKGSAEPELMPPGDPWAWLKYGRRKAETPT